MAAVVFRARDAEQREHLLSALDSALDQPVSVADVIDAAYEGEETSLYLWTFYDVGREEGYEDGHREGREGAFTASPLHAVARAKAKTRARQARRARKANRRAKR